MRRPSTSPTPSPGARREASGFTLIELVIVVAIVGILAATVLPLSHWAVKRQDEYELQRNLRIIRNAIDRYHDLALAGLIEVDPGETGYPPDLEVLVEGVRLTGDLPSPLPGVSGEFAASGGGLTGGLAGAMEAGRGAGALPIDTDERAEALRRGINDSIGQLEGMMGERGGRRGGGRGGLGLGDFSLDRSRDSSLRGGAPGQRGTVTDIDEIVLLRRIPVDPMTGTADWGLRCYGDPIADRSWCGRNVFDVYTKARGNGMDGRPYREW